MLSKIGRYLPAAVAIGVTSSIFYASHQKNTNVSKIEKNSFKNSSDFLRALTRRHYSYIVRRVPLVEMTMSDSIDSENAYGWFLVAGTEFAMTKNTKKEYFLQALESARKADDNVLKMIILTDALAMFPDLLMDVIILKETDELLSSTDLSLKIGFMLALNYAYAILYNIINGKINTESSDQLEKAKSILDELSKHTKPSYSFWSGVYKDNSALKPNVLLYLIEYHLLKADRVSQPEQHLKQAFDLSNSFIISVASQREYEALGHYYKGICFWLLGDPTSAVYEFKIALPIDIGISRVLEGLGESSIDKITTPELR